MALARLLHQDADVLLLDEPTRGIDIGSKAQIYDVIARAAASGKAVLMVSSYLPELFGLCDRLAVMSRGRLSTGATDRPSGRRNRCSTRPSTWRPRRDTHPPCPTSQARSSRRGDSTLAQLGPFLGLLAVIAVFALLTDSPSQYLSVRNFRIVVAQTVIVALGAIGMTMIIVSGGIDLSVGSVIALTGVVTAIGDPRRLGPARWRCSPAWSPAGSSASSTAWPSPG